MPLSSSPTTTLSVFSGDVTEESCVGTVAFPVRDHINAATATALLHTNWRFLPSDKTIELYVIQGSILTLQRNEAIQRMKGEWLLFIDDDMVWGPDDVGHLIESSEEMDADIMGALCFRRSAPHQPTLFMRETPTSGGYNYLEDWKDDIIEVDATGMAFVMIRKRVFEKIAGTPMPPLAERIKSGAPPDFFRWSGTLGEDIRFCQDAKAAGCRVFVDTRIKIGHIAEVEIHHRDFLLSALQRSDEEKADRQKVNDEMGLPTLTNERIKEKLGW